MTAQMLYHGTSTPRLKLILEENCLRRQGFGGFPSPKVSFTALRYIAEHFAHMAVCGDRHDASVGKGIPDGANAMPVVMVFDAEALADKYTLVLYNEPGIFDWEFELYSRRNIKPLDEVLVAVEPCEQEHEAYLAGLREEAP
jgi:hypothetical protein